jgi:hypothetical protein
MGELEDDIRATADAIATDSERLRAIEVDKVQLSTDDPAMLDLSMEAVKVADQIAAKAHAEDELVRQASEDDET